MAVKKPTPKKKTAKKAPKAAGSNSKIAKLEQRIAALEAKMGGNRPQAPRHKAVCLVLQCLECAHKMNGSLRYIWCY